MNRKRLFIAFLTTVGVLTVLFAYQGTTQASQDSDLRAAYMERFEADQLPVKELEAMGATPCINGFAGAYPCDNVDLLSFLPLSQMGGGGGNDIWGWTDPQTGKEYALMGRTNGTAFVDISNPTAPVYLGNLPTATSSTTWRDIKTDGNYAFIVSEASNHGMQVFDLTRLRNVNNPPVTFTADDRFTGFGSAHNIAVNEETNYAYVVGANACSGGLYMINIANPTNPSFAGCFSQDGYTHDVQCVVYNGPDADYQGREICFASNEDTLTIVDVTNKNNPTQISRLPYPGSAYAHQGWLTPNQKFFALGDELDEAFNGHNTKTYIFRVVDLDNPTLFTTNFGPTAAIDHNMYITNGRAYQSNYSAGLRIFNFQRQEIAYFDTYPSNNNTSFNGTWSNYPFFDSGIVIVSGISEGLFVLQPTLTAEPAGTWLSDQ